MVGHAAIQADYMSQLPQKGEVAVSPDCEGQACSAGSRGDVRTLTVPSSIGVCPLPTSWDPGVEEIQLQPHKDKSRT